MSSLYRQLILDHYKHPRNFGLLENPDAVFKMFNSACGDVIEISVKTDNKNIKEIKFKGAGCAISTASASLLTDYVKGKEINKIIKMDEEDIIKLINIKLSASRVKCAYLPLQVLQKTLSLIKI